MKLAKILCSKISAVLLLKVFLVIQTCGEKLEVIYF